MEAASQDTRSDDIPSFMGEDKVRQECKSLISSLPSDKDFLGRNLCNYNGFWFYSNTLQAVIDVQNHFRTLDTDVIVASFPKAGTTWLKALTFAIVNRSKYRSNPENHPLLSQNPHTLVPFLEIDLYSENKTPDLAKVPSPGLFATHMPFLLLQESVKESSCKIVYVCRNLKDNVVSAWHFRRGYMISEMHGTTLKLMIESFCRGVHFCGPFWDHALSYWKESSENPDRVFFTKYEDMKNEPRAQIKRLARFLGCPFTEEEEMNGSVDEILNLCSLRSLKDLEINKTGKAPCSIDCKNFFRKGEVGDWKNHLTGEMAKKMDEIVGMKLQGSGLVFE
ncbi:PREDICTED: cytosolic sulfotransferase 11-like [Tarenaya hassleriana]|uniref:cytosolic sulfotransferase 11-like n=1 Tax=Tarenaya hassleriana TaxID=28532 RepID=UPI00053C3963|nr:PREDICTED: cytosolic sulfotransferase 11-like [Tarenaya hassleriana]